LAAVVVADCEARGCILLDAAEAFGSALSDWFECLVAGAVESGPPLSPDSVRCAAGALRCCARWMPTHSAEQWSTAMNTATWPCSTVTVAVMSVPHIASIVSGMIVPSWFRGPRGWPMRVVAARPFSRIGRRTRSFDVRRPEWRSRAQTLR
jgi:hypothetical protein